MRKMAKGAIKPEALSSRSQFNESPSPFDVNLSLIRSQGRRTTLVSKRNSMIMNGPKERQKGELGRMINYKAQNFSWTNSKFISKHLIKYTENIEGINKAFSVSFKEKPETQSFSAGRMDEMEKINSLLEKASQNVVFLKEEEWNFVDFLGEIHEFRINCENRAFPVYFKLKPAKSSDLDVFQELRVFIHESKFMKREKTDFEFFQPEFSVKFSMKRDKPLNFFYMAIYLPKRVTVQVFLRFSKKLTRPFGYSRLGSSVNQPFNWFLMKNEEIKRRENGKKEEEEAGEKEEKKPKEERGTLEFSEEPRLFSTEVPHWKILERKIDQRTGTCSSSYFLKTNAARIEEFVKEKRLRISKSMQKLEERTQEAQMRKREAIKMKKETSLTMILKQEIIKRQVNHSFKLLRQWKSPEFNG